MRLKKTKLPDPKGMEEVNKKKKKKDVCQMKGKVNELHCAYKNKKITQSSYIRKLRRLKGQKKERVNTRTYTFRTTTSKDE